MKTLLDDRRVLLPVLLTAVVIAVGSVLIVLLAADATGASSSTAATSAPTSQAAGAATGAPITVSIASYKFAPQELKVKVGTSVTWTNRDSSPHTATAANGFDTGSLKQGQSKTITLSKPGTYTYVCQFHPFMTGKLVVR